MMSTSEKQSKIDARLAPFIGNDPIHKSEHGGMIPHAKTFHSDGFLMPLSQLRDSLEAYSAQIQEAVNSHGDH